MLNPNKLITVGARLSIVILLALICVSAAMAQTSVNAHPDRGISPFGSYSVSDIENISLSNGAVNLAIPLASLPSIAGGKLSFTFKAYYSSKIWDTRSEERRQPGGDEVPHPYYYVSIPRPSSFGGWKLDNRYQITFVNASDEYSTAHHPDEALLQNYSWYKSYLIAPDGSSHELRPLGYPSFWGSDVSFAGYFKDSPNTVGHPIAYYTSDGSYIWAKLYPRTGNSIADDPYSEVYLPDGTKIVETMGGVQRIIDANGNSIKIFTDANGVHYQDELTGREIKYVCANTNQCQVMYQTVGGGWASLDINFGTTTVMGQFYDVAAPDSCTVQEPFTQDFRVVREIVLPQTEPGVERTKFSFSYNSDTTDQTDVHYQNSCSSGDTTYHNPSHGLGELSRMVTSAGAVANYTYLYDASYRIDDGSNAAANSITAASVAHDGITDNWSYTFTGGAPAPWNKPASIVIAINPDGSFAKQYSYPHFLGWNSSLGATGYGGLIYRTNQSDKILTEKHWTRMVFSGANEITDGSNKLVFNPVVDAEYTTLLEPDSGGNPVAVKMSAKKYQYDYNGNLAQTTDYDWFDPSLVSRDEYGVPVGVPPSAQALRVTNNNYYNSALTADSPNVYAKRSLSTSQPLILNAVQERTVGVSQTRFSYDGQAYGTAPTVGNLTTSSRWDNVTNSWVSVGTTYDSYGNVTTITDAKGNVKQIFYEDATHALPTRMVVDPLNGTGQQTSTTTYDFSTGAVLTMTDPNGAVTTIDYTNRLLNTVDPFNRHGAAYTPAVTVNGISQRQKTTTTYEDHLRRVTVASDLNSEGDGLLKNRTTQDQLGHSVLSEESEDGTNFTVSSETVYDQAGRYIFQSNPHRVTAASTDGWMRSTKDTLGRVTEVATFSGPTRPAYDSSCNIANNCTGRVTTTYEANYTTVIDQAGKMRRSVTNASGQLVRVDEPDSNGSLGDILTPAQPTSYSYDVLGNLTQVRQGGQIQNSQYVGGQTRSFSFSSLSRLTSATNPEVCNAQGVAIPVTFQYDANGNLIQKTDARGIITSYVYDALNRPTSRTYQNDGGATSPIFYRYDSQNLPEGAPAFDRGSAAGHLVAVLYGSPLSATGSYMGYDAMGRVKRSIQRTNDGQTDQTYTIPNYDYDLAGNLKSETYPSGRVVLSEYDQAGRLSGVKSQGSSAYYVGTSANDTNPDNHIKYAAHGAFTAMKLGNGLWEQTSFNSRLQPIEIGLGTAIGNTDKLKLNYTYSTGTNIADNNGDVRSHTITVPSLTNPIVQTYNYDSLNRIQSISETGSLSQSFDYDRYGNRVITAGFVQDTAHTPHHILQGDPAITDWYDQNTNRLKTQTYDAAGNIIKDTTDPSPGNTFDYDAENKQIRYNGGAMAGGADYKYDGDGRRVKKVDGTGQRTTIFVYDAMGKMVAEYDTNPPSGGGTSYFTEDSLGTPRIITRADQSVKARHDYLPFGEEIGLLGGRAEPQGYVASGDPVRQKFTGQIRDGENQLYYFNARYYSSTLGRFTSVDPENADAQAESPQSWNAYVYAGNNPHLYTDPSGKEITICGPDGKNCYVHTNNEFANLRKYCEQTGDCTIADDRLTGGRIIQNGKVIATFGNELDGTPASEFVTLMHRYAPNQMKLMDYELTYMTTMMSFGIGGGRLITLGLNAGEKLCFVAGTPVLTKEGTKPIEEIKSGDEVLSYNIQTKQVESRTVVQTFRRFSEELLSISFEGEANPIGVTPQHPFYARVHRARDGLSSGDDIDGWVEARKLQAGDEVKQASGGWAKVLGIERRVGGATVYNFETADNHNYFVGQTGLLVHNQCSLLLQIAARIISKFGNLKCYECAEELAAELSKAGIKGEILEMSSASRYIVRAGQTGGEAISTNSVHYGVKVGQMVFDNFHPTGIPFSQWEKAYESAGQMAIKVFKKF